jgi:hypothetical protein
MERDDLIAGFPLSETVEILDGTKQRQLDQQAINIRLARAESRQDRPASTRVAAIAFSKPVWTSPAARP